ncbi:MAG: hypothetical protein ACI9EK_002534, partial [Psychroserpens sp.]
YKHFTLIALLVQQPIYFFGRKNQRENCSQKRMF